MASSSISIDPIMPEEYVMDDNKTCSPFILRKTWVEILPSEQILFQPSGGQDTIRFTLASNSDFWLADETYLKMYFTNTTTGYPGAGSVEGAPTAYPGINPYVGDVSLSSIGAHGLIRMMEIKAVASGTLLAQMQFYNHQMAAITQFTMESEAQRFEAGVDKHSFETVGKNNCVRYRNLKASTGEDVTAWWSLNNGINLLAFQRSSIGPVYSNPLGVVNVGDIITGFFHQDIDNEAGNTQGIAHEQITFKILGQGNYAYDPGATVPIAEDDDGFVYHVQVLSDNIGARLGSVATGGVVPAPGANLTNNIEIFGMVIQNNNVQVPFAKRVCDGNGHYICFNLKNSFAWYPWPLFLLKGGIEIILYLQEGDIALMVDPLTKTPLDMANTALSYTIQFPRLVARMSTPEPSIQRDFVSKWNSDMGLIYYCPQIVSKRVTGNNNDGTMNLSLQFGKRSIRSLIFAISPSSAYNQDAISRCMDSFRCGLQSHLRYYQLQIGSHLFPIRRMDVFGDGVEAYVQSRMGAPFAFFNNSMQENDNIQERGWIRAQHECADAFYWNSATGAHASLTEANVKATKVPEVKDRYYVIDLSRGKGKGAVLTGIDASMASIDLLLDRNGNTFGSVYPNTTNADKPGTIYWDEGITGSTENALRVLSYVGSFGTGISPVYWAHALHDHFIRLSAQGISVLN